LNITGYDILIFDFDGTIFELNLDSESYIHNLGYTMDEFVFVNPKIKKKVIYQLEKDRFDISQVKPNIKICQFIKENQNQPLALCSNNSEEVIQNVLQKFGFDSTFDIIVAVDVITPKPDPNGLLIIKEKYRKCLFIGDNDIDEQAALNAGIDFIYVQDFIKAIEK